MSYFIQNKLLYLFIFLSSGLFGQQQTLRAYVDTIPSNDTYVGCKTGLKYKVWNRSFLGSCNSFFGGSPGTAPSGFADTGFCSNTQYGDFVTSPAWNGSNDMVQIKGFINLPESGNYRFQSFSDDGSRVFVNNILVVNNDGLHGPRTISGSSRYFDAGIYPYECQFFERGGEDNLEVKWQKPSDNGFGTIPNNAFILDPDASCFNLWMNPETIATVYQCPNQLQQENKESGVYLFDPDNDGQNIFKGFYDKSLGGGWLMVLNYVHEGGTNPALNVRNTDLPLKGSDVLGTNEVNSVFWGHASNSLLNQFAITEVRFMSRSSSNIRLLHFSTTNSNVINYIQSGTGSMNGIQSSPTIYSGSGSGTSSLPSTANTFSSNQGDLALTERPMARSSSNRWSIKGSSNDWESDDNVGNNNFSTIHRVWIRTAPCNNSSSLNIQDQDNIVLWQSIYNSSYESILEQDVVNDQPLFIDNTAENINYNPVCYFDSQDRLYSNSTIGIENSELTALIVTKETVDRNNRVLKFKRENNCNERYQARIPRTNGNIEWHIEDCNTPGGINATYPNVLNQVTITTLTNSLSQNKQEIFVDGALLGSDNTGHRATDLNRTELGQLFRGYIGNLIVINKYLNAADRLVLQSFLAIKYGVELKHDYVNSANELIYDISNGYGNDIFGIGRDVQNTLYQKKSKSEAINAIDLSFELTNDIANRQFLIAGHNGADLSKLTLNGEPNVIRRRWFADMTGNVGTVNISIKLSDINSLATDASQVKIILSANPLFQFMGAIPATSISNGYAYFEGIPLYDKYFTFAAP